MVPPFLKFGSASLLCEKQTSKYPVLYDKQKKGYREKDVVSNAWNAMAKELEFNKNAKSE